MHRRRAWLLAHGEHLMMLAIMIISLDSQRNWGPQVGRPPALSHPAAIFLPLWFRGGREGVGLKPIEPETSFGSF